MRFAHAEDAEDGGDDPRTALREESDTRDHRGQDDHRGEDALEQIGRLEFAHAFAAATALMPP